MAGKKKSITLLQEENLAEYVKKYPCLFDKTDKGFKEKDVVNNAWDEIATNLDFVENGKFILTFSHYYFNYCRV